MAFLESMSQTFNSGDPVVRQWALVHSNWAPFLCCGMYVFFVKRLGPDLMRNRKPFDLRLPMMIYNFCIVATYSSCILTLLYYFFTTAEASRKICSPGYVVSNPKHYTYICSSVGWVIYVLKYVEFMDTVFFVLRKKYHLITNLHVIHHTVLPLAGWFLFRTETTGLQFLPGGLNAFIHIITYTYYGLAAMGPEVQKKLWWKQYLTMLQMAQFVIILLFMFIVLPLSGCTTNIYGVYIDIFCATIFLALFYNFYTKTYKTKDSRKELQNGSAQNGVAQNGSAHNGVVQNGSGVHIQNGKHKAS